MVLLWEKRLVDDRPDPPCPAIVALPSRADNERATLAPRGHGKEGLANLRLLRLALLVTSDGEVIAGVEVADLEHPPPPALDRALAEVDALDLVVAPDRRRRALDDDRALVEAPDLLRHREDHVHVVLGEEHSELALAGEALGEGHAAARLLGRHAGRRLVQEEQGGFQREGDAE